MTTRSPRLVWVDSKEDSSVQGYFHPNLDKLLVVPGYNKYIGRGLFSVGGNSLRGRETNENALHIWYTDEFDPDLKLTSNQSLYGFPGLIAEALCEFIWKGPIVAVMKVGSEYDPRRSTDITLTAYRDAIDNLGYYRDMVGSLITGLGREEHFGKVLLATRGAKVNGVRINCVGDQNQGNPELVTVAVPKTHPLFNVEGDDPLDIPDRLDRQWVAKRYARKSRSKTSGEVEGDLANPLARLLLLSVLVENGKWKGVNSSWNDPNIGSILVVDQGGGNVRMDEVRDMCKFIQQSVVPLMTEDRALTGSGQYEVLDVIENR
jgi:hypothetical protein